MIGGAARLRAAIAGTACHRTLPSWTPSWTPSLASQSTGIGGAVLAAVGLATSSVVLCAGDDDEHSPLLEGLKEEGSEMTAPGEFKEIELQKQINVESVEGLNAMVTSVVQAAPGCTFLIQHNLTVASGPTDAYNVTVSSDTPSEALNGVLQNTPDGLMVQAIVRKAITESISLQAHGLFQKAAAVAGRFEARVKGPDYFAIAHMSAGQRLGGTGVGLSYFQAVTPTLALGADTAFLTSNLAYLTHVTYSLYGKYATKDTCVLAKYDRTRNDVTVRYWRQAAEKLRLGASIAVDLDRLESKFDVSYEMPVRMEDGGFPYTTLKGKLFSDAKFVTQVDHTLLNGQGMMSLHASLDHFKQDYKVGVSLKLQT